MITNAAIFGLLLVMPAQASAQASGPRDLKPALNPYPPTKGQKVDRKIELTPLAQKFIRNLALIAIPDQFEDDKRWGSTKRVQSGLSVRLEAGRLRTHRKWKKVKHGRWQKYFVEMVEPEKRFRMQVSNVVKSPDGAYHFDVSCFARLKVQARWQNWQLGVPMLRLTTEAVTDVRLDARCELKMDFDYSSFPPAVELKPVVHAADVRVGNLRLRQLGQMKGRVADEFSGTVKSVLNTEIARRRRDLPKKINKKIAKKKDDLKISLGEWLKFSGEKDDREKTNR